MRVFTIPTAGLLAAFLVSVSPLAVTSAVAGGPKLGQPKLEQGHINAQVHVLTDQEIFAKYQAAVASHVFTLGSKKYAKLRSFDAGVCEAGETKIVDVQARITDGRPAARKASCNNQVEALYSSPDQSWAIQSYTRTITANSPYNQSSDGVTPANYTFNSSNTYSSVQSSLDSYVASLDIPDVVKADLNVQISNQLSNYQSYANSLSASAATIKHDAKVCIPGTWQAGGHYDAWLKVELKCVPKVIRSSSDLQTDLKAWIDTVVAGL